MAKVEHFPYYSNILGRDIMIEVTGHWGHPILMFPSSGGQYTQNTDFGLNGSVMSLVEQGRVKLYNVETIDMMSFYNEGMDTGTKMYNYGLYMQFLQQEFIPFVQNECNVHRIATAGVSFGGYHAANLAFRSPDVISHLIAMSAAFNIRSQAPLSDDMSIYFNCPNEYMRNEDGWKYNHMNIVLGTSDWDICLGKNIEMSNILNDKGITHWYDEKKWVSHDWPLWRMMFPEYLENYF